MRNHTYVTNYHAQALFHPVFIYITKEEYLQEQNLQIINES